MTKTNEAAAAVQNLSLEQPLNLTNIYLELGQVLEKMGELDQALTAYRRAVDSDPSSAKGLLLLGNALRHAGDFEDAAQILSRALEHTKEEDKEGRATALFGLALNSYDQKEYKAAIELTETALALNESAPLYTLIGKSLYFLDRDEEALSAFNKAIALEPTAIEAWIGKAEALEALARVHESLAAINYALILDPENETALVDCGRLLSEAEQFDEALLAFDKAIAKNPNNAFTWSQKTEILRWLGRASEALESINQALANTPKDPELLITKGQILTDLGDPKAAIEFFDQAIRDPTWAPTALDNKANSLLLLNRPEEAIALYDDERLNLNPAWTAAHKAHLLRYLEKFSEALAQYDRALEIQPKSSWILAGKAEALYRMRNYKDSIEYWDEVIELSPDSPEAYGRRAEAYRFLREYDRALADLNYALNINPKIDWFLYQRYAVRESIGPSGEARQDLEAAITYGKDLYVKAPGNWMHTCNLALYHLTAGDNKEAERLYVEAIESGASIYSLNEAVKDLDDNRSLIKTDIAPIRHLLTRASRSSPPI